MLSRQVLVTRGALALLVVCYAATHVAAVFTDAFNWDEFALFHRAQHADLTGEIQSGGRPGLGVIVLIPFIAGCENHVAAAIGARLAWCAVTFALLAGLACFLRIATRRSEGSWHSVVLGTAAFALVPLFLRWSLQVRTDQPAIAAALWGGVALMASRERQVWALAGGALFGVGYLFSQKAVYIGALAGIVAVGALYIEGAVNWRRELVRALAFATGALAILASYKLLVPLFFAPPRAVSLEVGLDLFKWYRWVLHYRLYPSIVTAVIPQLAVLVLVLVAAVRAFRLRIPERKPLLVALVVMLLGYAVARFHTASFPYFWITIGVFPAVAIAIGWTGIRALLPRAHIPVALCAGLVMLALAVRYRVETLADTQRVQRDTFAVLERNVPPTWRGFQADGAMVCRRDPAPFPVYLGQDIQRRLFSARAEENRRAFIAEFTSRPVAFLLRTQRLDNFPSEVKDFWKRHYVPYYGPIEIAGSRVEGAAGSAIDVDVIVEGVYRWRGGGRVAIAGKELAPGQTVELARGVHRVDLLDPVSEGTLALDLPAIADAITPPFYAKMFLVELGGVRYDWW